jgi:hypothetical protein
MAAQFSVQNAEYGQASIIVMADVPPLRRASAPAISDYVGLIIQMH